MKKFFYFVCLPAFVLYLAYKAVDFTISAPIYRSEEETDHFDGESFRNPSSAVPKGFADVLRWRLTREEGPWREWVTAEPGPAPPERVASGQIRITFVNHSTLLIQMDGLNILTDPIWSERASPVSWAGPKRVRPPGIRYEDLPPIDAMVVSHNHYDHMNIPTLAKVSQDHLARIFTPLGNAAMLEKKHITGATEMDWWQTAELKNHVKVICVPAQHWSGRGFRDRMKTLWGGFIIKGPSGVVYFAGDTGLGNYFEEIAKREGPIDVALLPIGAFRPRWFMELAHLSPSDAIQVHQRMKAKESIAIHFGTFQLGDDGETEAADLLNEELTKSGAALKSRFHVLDFGESKVF